MTLLQVEGVTVGEGEVVALVGHDVAAKAAIVEAAAGLRPGRVVFAGEAARLAFVPAGRRVFAGLTVDENLALGAYRDRRDRELVARRRADVLARFPRLAERLAQRAGTLSGGEQQLLVIARALMSAPRLLVLDEPSAGLGPRAVALVADALRAVEAAILLSDQGLQLARALADRVLLLEDGRVVLDAPREQALADPRLGVGYLSSAPSPPR